MYCTSYRAYVTWEGIAQPTETYRAYVGLYKQAETMAKPIFLMMPFSKDSTDLTTQDFLLIFDMLSQVNQKHLLAPFPVSIFFFQNGLHNKNLLKAPTFTQIGPYQGKCNTTTSSKRIHNYI